MSRRLGLALSAALAAIVVVAGPVHAEVTITELPDLLREWDFAEAFAINDAGIAVGVSGSPHATRAVSWDVAGAIRDLGGPEGAAHVRAEAINSDGVIAGHVVTAASQHRALRFNLDGSITALPGASSWGTGRVRAINDHGVMVGASQVEAPDHPVRWSADGEILNLGLPDRVSSAEVWGINNSGVAVGFSSGGGRAFKWTVS